MSWILDEYSKFHGYSPAVVTGKPVVSCIVEIIMCFALPGFHFSYSFFII
jgi:hypothetical protein